MKHKDITRPNEAALRRLLDKYKGHTVEMIMRLAWQAGLRRAEMYDLKWCDVDLKNHIIHLPKRDIYFEDELYACLAERYKQVSQTDPDCKSRRVIDHNANHAHSFTCIVTRKLKRVLGEEETLHDIKLAALRSDYIIRVLEKHGNMAAMQWAGITEDTLQEIYGDYMQPGRYNVKREAYASTEIDEERLLKLLHNEGSSPVAITLWLVWELGIPTKEIVDITWDQVDFDRKQINLPDKTYTMTEPAFRVLKEAYDKRTPAAVKQPYVVLKRRAKKQYTTQFLSKTLRIALVRAGLESLHMRSLLNDAKDRKYTENICAYIREHGSIGQSQAAKVTGLSYDFTHVKLTKMKEKGILEKRESRYYLPEK